MIRSGEKTLGNVPLEFRFRGDPDLRSRIGPLRLVGPEEVKISFDRYTSSGNDLKRFETGITYLHAGSISPYWTTALCNCNFRSVVSTSSVRKLV